MNRNLFNTDINSQNGRINGITGQICRGNIHMAARVIILPLRVKVDTASNCQSQRSKNETGMLRIPYLPRYAKTQPQESC
jgi:hypothetical protein